LSPFVGGHHLATGSAARTGSAWRMPPGHKRNPVLLICMRDTMLLVVGAIAVERISRLALTALDLRRSSRSRGVPAGLDGLLDPEAAEQARGFAVAQDRLALVRGLVSLAVTLWLLTSGVLPWLDWRIERAGVVGSHAFVLFLVLAGMVAAAAQLPFSAWRTFVVDRRFRLVRPAARAFLADRLVTFLAALGLGVTALYAVYALMARTGPAWWALLLAVALALQLGLPWLWTSALAPRLGRQASLPDGRLRRRLEGLAVAAGVPLHDVVVVASTRPHQANATLAGLVRPVVRLDEALLARLDEDEIEAVVAHELAHLKLRHTWHRGAMSLATSALLVGLLAVAVASPALAAAFGFRGPSLHAALALASIAGGAVLRWLAPLEAAISRRREVAADALAVRLVGCAEPLGTALLELSEENLTNPWPHPWSVAWRFTHPPLERRLALLAEAGGEG
jgi:STE24 endopeptidase